MTRIVHFSDPHLGRPVLGLRHLTPRRTLGMINFHLRRRWLFRDENLRSAVECAIGLRPDVAVISGDFTNVGLAGEYEAARGMLRPLLGSVEQCVLVPGNHDRYGRDGVEHFRSVFAEWLPPEYPYVTRGEDVAVVALDGGHPSRWIPGQGSCPKEQLAALDRLLGSWTEPERVPWALVCHYPVCGPTGRPDHSGHRLTNAADLVQVLHRRPPALYMHGHIHRPWLAKAGLLPDTLLANAGSVTMRPSPSFLVHDFSRDGVLRSALWRRQGHGAWEEVQVVAGPTRPAEVGTVADGRGEHTA